MSQKTSKAVRAYNAMWDFPPNQNGAQYGFRDAAASHFKADPISYLVRETIQNSLDAKVQDLYEPVLVRFESVEIPTTIVGSESLHPHITACLALAEQKQDSGALRAYSKASEMLSQPTVPCLSIIDSGTTGLVDESWDALVMQEGIVHKTTAAPGGSNGIGKNAVFNVSGLRTVFYSTRYLARRKGREEKLQGKARLISHPDQTGSFSNLQHIGFYRTDEGEPLKGREIPKEFRLKDNGTGVFILGFDPQLEDWGRAAAAAVVDNFFLAIHSRQLTVELSPGPELPTIRINHETLDDYFGTMGSRQNYAYYRAVREEPKLQIEAGNPLGPLNIYILKGEGPRRTACVNLNGMLITDSRERKRNYIAPPNRVFWPDYAAVVMPETASGDQWLRTMENAGHDAITPHQIQESEDRKRAEALLSATRKQLEEAYESAFTEGKYEDVSNITELAYAIPESSRQVLEDIPLQTSIVDSKTTPTGPDDNSDNSKEDKSPAFKNQRIIVNSNNEAIIAFNNEIAGPITIELHSTGAERSTETRVQIIQAEDIDNPATSITLVEGRVHLEGADSQRIRLKVTAAQDIRNLAFTF